MTILGSYIHLPCAGESKIFVQYRFDDAAGVDEFWSILATRQGGEAKLPASFIKRLSSSKRFVARVVDTDADIITMTFDVSGFTPVYAGCKA